METQFFISKTALETAANMLSRVINPKSPLPILSNILCTVRGEELYMRSSDAEVSIETTLPLAGTPTGEGSFCVPATRLCAALSALNEQVLTITTRDNDPTAEGENTIRITYDTGETYFGIEHAEQYPLPPQMELTSTLSVKAARLGEALRCTQWASATDELRSQLCGVYLNSTPSGLDVVATDGRCLTRYILREVTEECTVNMPRKAVKLLIAMLEDGDAVITFSPKHGRLRTGTYTVSFVQLEGTYPNYNAVVPKETRQTSHADRDALMGSIRRVMPFGNMASGLLTLIFDGNTLTMRGDDRAYGCGAQDRASVNYEGEATTIGVNGPLMLNLLTHMEAEKLRVRMTDPQHPVVVEPAAEIPDTDILMMCMPMRVEE